MQETLTEFEVQCCASQLLHKRCGVHSCVQAAAAARVAEDGRGILYSAQIGDGVSVLCHLIADADAVNKRSGM